MKQKIGKIIVSYNLVKNQSDNEGKFEFMNRLFPLKCEYNQEKRYFEIIVYSNEFRELNEGEEIPVYTWIGDRFVEYILS